MSQDRRRKECFFIKNKINYIDYKGISLLQKFLTERGKILPRRITGVSCQAQRQLSKAVKRAREAGLLSYISND